jgi:TetR/AcrR family tetracycline transcriptional repressor
MIERTESKHRGRLTRDRVIETALALMDDEGLEAVTMRRVGRELGVEAMSLYNHVEDKEDLLDGICECVMSGFRFPEPSDDWAENLRRGARAWRDLLKQHPNVTQLFAERHGAVRTAGSLLPMEFALRIFRSAGLSIRDAVLAFQAFGGYIEGSVMMTSSKMPGHHHEAALEETFSRADAAQTLPNLAEALPYFENCDEDEQFEFGLELLVEGLRARAAG